MKASLKNRHFLTLLDYTPDEIEALIDLENGRLQSARFRGDFFSMQDPDELADALRGCRMDYTSILSALQEADVSAHIHGLRKEQLAALLADV